MTRDIDLNRGRINMNKEIEKAANEAVTEVAPELNASEKVLVNVTQEFINLAGVANNALMNASDRTVINQGLLNLKDAVNNQNGHID